MSDNNIVVLQGNLAKSSTAPSVVRTNNSPVIASPQGNVSGSVFAPAVARSNNSPIITIPQGYLTKSNTAPTVAAPNNSPLIRPPQGNLVNSSAAPSFMMRLPVIPPTGDRHITRTGSDYVSAWSSLLPQGMAWPRTVGSTLMKTVTGLAQIWGDVETAASKLLEIDSDPRKTSDLLPDWNRNWDLPDHAVIIPKTDAGKRKQLVWKMTLNMTPSRANFLDMANNALGYDVQFIREWAPFMCGISRVGDTRNLDVNGDFRWEIGAPEMRFYWSSNVHALGSEADLEFYFTEFMPAHTWAMFRYADMTSLDFSKPFNSGLLIPLGMA
jgi:uncharacterized protein YmfQ (DUF2313 family)